MKTLYYLGAVVLTLGLALGEARADQFFIDDLADVATIRQDGTQSSLTVLPDSGGEFLHFLVFPFAPGIVANNSFTESGDLLEPNTGALSDRLFLRVTSGLSFVEGLFASDPAPFPPAGEINPFPPIVEDGTFQLVGIYFLGVPGGGMREDDFFVRSDVTEIGPEPIPEPSTLTLLGLGALGLTGYVWRWRKQQAC
jgi:hypothetical protein